MIEETKIITPDSQDTLIVENKLKEIIPVDFEKLRDAQPYNDFTLPDWGQRIIDLENRLTAAQNRITQLELLLNQFNVEPEDTSTSVKLIGQAMMRMTVGTGNQNANYIHITPGLLVQWGVFNHTGSDNMTVVSFAKSYYSADSYSVVATYATSTTPGYPIRLHNTSQSGFTANGMTCQIRWIAVGYAEP